MLICRVKTSGFIHSQAEVRVRHDSYPRLMLNLIWRFMIKLKDAFKSSSIRRSHAFCRLWEWSFLLSVKRSLRDAGQNPQPALCAEMCFQGFGSLSYTNQVSIFILVVVCGEVSYRRLPGCISARKHERQRICIKKRLSLNTHVVQLQALRFVKKCLIGSFWCVRQFL